MTNERIVELIRQGRDDLYVTLWEQVKNFIAAQAYKRIRRSQGFDKGGTVGSVDAEDLVQSGYIALTRPSRHTRRARLRLYPGSTLI